MTTLLLIIFAPILTHTQDSSKFVISQQTIKESINVFNCMIQDGESITSKSKLFKIYKRNHKKMQDDIAHVLLQLEPNIQPSEDQIVSTLYDQSFFLKNICLTAHLILESALGTRNLSLVTQDNAVDIVLHYITGTYGLKFPLQPNKKNRNWRKKYHQNFFELNKKLDSRCSEDILLAVPMALMHIGQLYK